jgi:hypothetical protein
MSIDEDVCANCGIAEVDNITLEECDGCDLVRYCSDKCRGEHQDQHEEECKKRKAEMHDKKLFTQPDETHHGDCPICFLPLPLDRSKSMFWPCCSKLICRGCQYSMSNGGRNCPFCREPKPSKAESEKRLNKRVKANDPAALCLFGGNYYKEGNYDDAFKYFSKAAKLGDLDAHYRSGFMYMDAKGTEKDVEKAVHHFEKAAIGGHPWARHELACYEEEVNGNMERSVKHLIIAANLGDEDSMKALWDMFKEGHIRKNDLETTLRTHKAAVDATKSPQREAAEVLDIS